MREFQMDKQLFSDIKAKTVKEIENTKFDRTFSQAFYELDYDTAGNAKEAVLAMGKAAVDLLARRLEAVVK